MTNLTPEQQELILLGLQYIESAAYSVERKEDAAALRKQLEKEWKDEVGKTVED